MLLLFLETNACTSPYVFDRYITDEDTNSVKVLNNAYLHVEFQAHVRFFFLKPDHIHQNLQDDGPLGSLEAIVTSDVIKFGNSSINEYYTPILTPDRRVCGNMRFKLSQISTNYSIASRKLVWEERPIFIGHRGLGSNKSGRRIMENSLTSYNLAMALTQAKLAGIELDVTMTADEKLVVYHDLHFPIKVGQNIREVAIPTLRYADLCRRKFERSGSDADIHIERPCILEEDCPLLETVLRKLRPLSAGIVIELKYPTNNTIRNCPDLGKFSREHLVKKVLDCLKTHQDNLRERWVILSSFDPDIVWMLSVALAAESPDITIVHNCWFGNENELEDNTVDFSDSRNRSPKAAIGHCQKIRGGLALEATYILSDGFSTQFTDAPSLRLLSYGSGNLRMENIHAQFGIGAFFIDDIDIICNQTN